MTKMLYGKTHLLRVFILALLFTLGCVGAAMAQTGIVCPGDAGYSDWVNANAVVYWDDPLIPLPSVNWTQTPFYPVDGTYIDEIDTVLSEDGEKHYSLESEFSFFGIPVDFSMQETSPPAFYLPQNWRNRDMITLEWNKSDSSQIIREPDYRRGMVFMPDPSPFADEGEEMSIAPGITVYGNYEGCRDQVFELSLRHGSSFIGLLDDVVYSIHDNGTGYLDSTVAWTPVDSLMEAGLADCGIGEEVTIEVEIGWLELHALNPNSEEFEITEDDEVQDGTIILFATYLRQSADQFDLIETNMDCIHEIGRGLWISFTPGAMTIDYSVHIVVENFEGYNVWRRIVGSSDTWVNIWSMGFNEEADKFYWWWIDGMYAEGEGINQTAGTDDGYVIGSLTPVFGLTDEMVFLDFDVHNGFTYEYAVTSFDRGFRPSNGGNDHYIVNNLSKEEMNVGNQRIILNLPATDTVVKNIYAVPNPLRTGKSSRENPNYHNFPGNVVQFVGMTDDTKLKVFNLAGDLLFEAENSDPLTSNITWDTRNQAGELVGSGVYIFRVEEEGTGEEEYGRLCIIR
ncbi:MAG: hypothetical protein GY835_09795 [bacterium]|nr:hypothetical protein [bacterium]